MTEPEASNDNEWWYVVAGLVIVALLFAYFGSQGNGGNGGPDTPIEPEPTPQDEYV